MQIKNNKIIVLAILVIVLLVSGWYLYKVFLAKELVVYNNYFNRSKAISDLYPLGRVSSPEKDLDSGERFQRISSDLTYFDVDLPKSYDFVDLTIKYINPAQNFLEVGLLQKQNKSDQEYSSGGFTLKPIENRIIDYSNWERLEQNNFLLLQKNKKFDSVKDFLVNPPVDQGIGVFNYKLNYNYKIDNYIADNSLRQINAALNGGHEFLTYLENENMDLEFDLESLGSDTSGFKLEILNQAGEVLKTEKWNNIVKINKNFGNGLFWIRLSGIDFKINKILTQQKYFVAKNKVNLIDPADLFTYGHQIYFKAENETGWQDVLVNGESLPVYGLSKTAVWPQSNNSNIYDIQEVNVNKGNLLVSDQSVFAFSKDQLFNPDKNVKNLKAGFDENTENYILAKDYVPPKKMGRYQMAIVNFDLGQTENKKQMSFLISASGLDFTKGEVYVYEIKAKFSRRSITLDRIKNKIR